MLSDQAARRLLASRKHSGLSRKGNSLAIRPAGSECQQAGNATRDPEVELTCCEIRRQVKVSKPAAWCGSARGSLPAVMRTLASQ